MDRIKKIELIQRTLGIRHKLKVHETMKAPETHEDLAVMLNSKWELGDELHAIEELLNASRQKNMEAKKAAYVKEIAEDAKELESTEKTDRKKAKKTS